MTELSFQAVFAAANWRPIRGCPGRYVLEEAPSALSLHDLLQTEVVAECHRSERAPDLVWLVRFPDGGVISYQKPSGQFVHTLADESGFARKLAQLGITLKSRVR